MAKAKAGGHNKTSLAKISKQLQELANEYYTATAQFGKDLNELNTKGKDGGAVWTGKNAKAWSEKAVKHYNANVREYATLEPVVNLIDGIVTIGKTR